MTKQELQDNFGYESIKDLGYALCNNLSDKQKIVISDMLGHGGDWTHETEMMKKWMKAYIKDKAKDTEERLVCQSFKMVLEVFKRDGL